MSKELKFLEMNYSAAINADFTLSALATVKQDFQNSEWHSYMNAAVEQ
jgi:hypothetical protein